MQNDSVCLGRVFLLAGLNFWYGQISIDHEDASMSVPEGLTKSVSLLREALISELYGAMFWTACQHDPASGGEGPMAP